MNEQPWLFTIVTDPKLLDRIAAGAKRFMAASIKADAYSHGGAPLHAEDHFCEDFADAEAGTDFCTKWCCGNAPHQIALIETAVHGPFAVACRARTCGQPESGWFAQDRSLSGIRSDGDQHADLYSCCVQREIDINDQV